MLRAAFAALLALGAATALFAAAGAASDDGAREPPAVARQQQARPTGSDWSCSITTVRGPHPIGSFWQDQIDHIHYQVSKREVCSNSATNETWTGSVTRVSYWQCQNAQREIVACPS